MRIEFEGSCEPDSRFYVNDGGPELARARAMPLEQALLVAIYRACETGREVHLEQFGKLAGRVIPNATNRPQLPQLPPDPRWDNLRFEQGWWRCVECSGRVRDPMRHSPCPTPLPKEGKLG